MKSTRSYLSFLVAAAVALLLLSAARAEEATTIKFSDPAKPGTLKIVLMRGDLQIAGTDTQEVAVKSEAKPVTQKPRKDGMRVITSSSGYALSEKDNTITLDARTGGWGGGTPSDFRLTVPRSTNIIVANSFGGDIRCTGIAGDLEINSIHGEIRLDEIGGGVVVTTTNGEIRANVRELREGKPLSFTSYNGGIDVGLPPEAKANVRLRTQNGDVVSNFDEKVLITKAESSPRGRRPVKSATTISSRGDVQVVVQDAVRLGAEVAAAAKEIAMVAKEAAAAAKANAAADAEAAANGLPPVPPIPKMPPLPPMTGGQLVTGTLNGGGPEISVTTMNGDVTLRKLEKK